MKHFHNITINAVTGAIIGKIFLLPMLGWLYSGHGLIELDWTIRFLVVGIIWGIVCGVAIGLVPLIVELNLSRRILTGMMIGGPSGMIFYLIGDYAFMTDDSLLVIFSRSLWGIVFGMISGGLCTAILGILYRLFSQVRIKDNSGDQTNNTQRFHFKQKLLSSFVGSVIGMVVGGFLLVLLGQLILTTVGFLLLSNIIWCYSLPLLLGCITAIYAFVKPFQTTMLQKSMDGLKNGITFSLLSILYFRLLSSLILWSPSLRPEFMKRSFLLEFVLGVAIVFTAMFGIIDGIAGAASGEIFAKWRSKPNTAA